MSTHNVCFHGEIRKISIFLVVKSALSRGMVISNRNAALLFSNILAVFVTRV